MDLILVRHGEVDAPAGLCLGQTDAPLSAAGFGAVQQLAMAATMRPARADYQQALREARATVRARAAAGLDVDRVAPDELAADPRPDEGR